MSARRLLLCACLLLGLPGVVCAALCPPLPRGVEFALGAYADARALLWRVSAPNGRSSVILGTMHLADPRVLQVLEAVRPAFVASRRFALEVVLDQAAMRTLEGAMFYADGRTLGASIGEELFTRTAGYLARHGIPAELAASLKPWAAFTMLSQPPPSAGLPLDLALMAAAAAAGKPVSGLETVAEQIDIFEGLAAKDAVALLREAVCHYDVMQADLEQMVSLYAARDLAALMRLSLKYVDARKLPMLEQLLWARNRRMVERMQPELVAGDSFIALGAMHLPGDRGVLRLLERRGYTVEAIY